MKNCIILAKVFSNTPKMQPWHGCEASCFFVANGDCLCRVWKNKSRDNKKRCNDPPQNVTKIKPRGVKTYQLENSMNYCAIVAIFVFLASLLCTY